MLWFYVRALLSYSCLKILSESRTARNRVRGKNDFVWKGQVDIVYKSNKTIRIILQQIGDNALQHSCFCFRLKIWFKKNTHTYKNNNDKAKTKKVLGTISSGFYLHSETSKACSLERNRKVFSIFFTPSCALALIWRSDKNLFIVAYFSDTTKILWTVAERNRILYKATLYCTWQNVEKTIRSLKSFLKNNIIKLQFKTITYR